MTEFPAGFFDRADEGSDAEFYSIDRLVTHIDAGAIETVGALYRSLGIDGDVLDVCASWVSHFDRAPARLVALGMNANELAANVAATDTLVHDLNVEPRLPFDDATFDAVTCCVSVDYLTRPVEVFAEVARVLRPGGVVVVTFSNRCFPTKAIRGWLAADDQTRCAVVATYVASSDLLGTPTVELRNPGTNGDPLYAVWARKHPEGVRIRPATSDDQALITEMQYVAIFVPPGNPAAPRSVLDEPEIARYHVDFGTAPGDDGRVAVDADGHAVGAVWVRRGRGYGFVDDSTPELAIAIRPESRGRGVGEALMRSMLAAVPRVSLSVGRRNPARRLYERLGFTVVRADDDHSLVMLHDARNGAGS